MYLTLKSFKEKDRVKVLHWLTACCSPVFDCLYSNNDVIIPNRRQLPVNDKNLFPARKNSFPQSQNLVPAKHKQSPIPAKI